MKQLNWYQIFGKSNIPDGRTVTPTDDIQIWLNCANIWDKTYTTLLEVLNDTDTLSALMASNNAVDYLVRSTTWAAFVSVPKMTSNTTPSGEVIYDYAHSDYKPWYAFDKNLSTFCAGPSDSPTLHYWGYDFTEDVLIRTVMFAPRWDHATRTKVQASHDKSTWVDLTEFIARPITATPTPYCVTLNNNTAYRYYRCIGNVTDGSGYGMNYYEIQFYSASIVTDATAMTYIGQNNYCANTLLADATWCEAICNSEYFESVLNVKVPTMTDNTHPSGEASASSYDSDHYAYKAMDGNSGSYWFCRTGNSTIGYDFGRSINAYLAIMLISSQDTATRTYTQKIQSSSDGVTWNDESTAASITTTGSAVTTKIIFSAENKNAFRLNFASSNDRSPALWTLQFYGREDV